MTMKKGILKNEKGFALILAAIILAVVSSFTLYFSLAGRMAGSLAKDYFYGTMARYNAESGIETLRARIQVDVTRLPLVQLRVDANENGSWAEDIDVLTPRGVLDQNYSTRKDGFDENANGQTDEANEIHPLGMGGQAGFYATVTDLGRGIDLNLSSPDAPLNSSSANQALKYLLARFPTVNEINTGTDTLVTGGLVDAIVNYRNTQLGGRFLSTEELRGVPGMTDNIYNQIKPFVTATTPQPIIGGGLIAHYYNNITGYPSNVSFDYSSYAGSVIEKGSGGYKKGGDFVFAMNSGVDFEGAQVDPASFSPASVNPRPITLTRPGVITNDEAPGTPVRPTSRLTFGVHWEGFIYIPEDQYVAGSSAPLSFRVIATGGARMKIAGQPVVRTNDFWNSDHNGANKFSSTDYFQVSLPLGNFPIGWQPIEIDYWCNNKSPVFLIIWNQGFHFRPGSVNDPPDPDVDMGSQTLLIPSATFGYKAGGFYEIRSTGVVRNAIGNAETEKTLVGRYQLFNFLHDTLVRDFQQGSYLAGQISLKDSYPVAPINTWYEVNEEFSRVSPYRRQYDTIANAIKLGYWTNFDERSDEWDATTGFAGWKPRNAETTLALQDVDGDGDRELVITSNDNTSTDPYVAYYSDTGLMNVPAADLVGSGTVSSPSADYIYRYFYCRLREIANRGPIDRVAGVAGGVNPPDQSWKNVLEDYKDPVSDSTNFNADSNPNPDGPVNGSNPAYRAEDKNLSGTISSIANNDGPHSYWVGQPLFRRTDSVGGDWPFYTEQFVPGPNGTTTKNSFPSGKGHVQFRRNNGKIVNLQSSSGWGYNNLGYEWLLVNGKTWWWSSDLTWLYQNRPVTDTGIGNTFLYLGFTNNLGLNQNVTFGYRSIGNEATYPRAIDSIRIFPISPQYQGLAGSPSASFTSRNMDAGQSVTWGAVSWLKYPSGDWTDAGGNLVAGYAYSQTNFKFGTGSSPSPSPSSTLTPSASRGGFYKLPQSMDGTRYARYGIDFFIKQFDPVNTNVDPPLFEEMTVTYQTTPKLFYLREGVKGD